MNAQDEFLGARPMHNGAGGSGSATCMAFSGRIKVIFFENLELISSMPNHHDAGRPVPEGNSDNAAACRITELEFHLTHQQRMCEQLNEVATEQSRRLERLERAVVRLERQLKELRDQPRQAQEPTDPLDERPPHY